MYLRSLALKDFAGVEDRTLTDFQPGINVVVGDNEAGKSTLLLALRAAFFQKHRATGEAAKALAPYGRQVRPEITVGFDLRGMSYTLTKGFLQRPDAALSWAGGSLAGNAVEERLAELLGFSHPGRGESKLGEHQGAFGLLWVEQGRSHEHDLDLGVGRNAVTASLEGEIGQILGGERGRAMLLAAKTAQERFFTASGRVAASSPLKAVEDALQALGTELVEKQVAHRDYEQKIDRLRSRRETLSGYVRDDTVAAMEKALEAAEAEAREVADFEKRHHEAARELGHAEARRLAAFEKLDQRESLTRRLDDAGRLRDASALALDDVRRSHAVEVAEVARLEGERGAARKDHAAAEAGDEAATMRAERARLVEEAATLEARLTEAVTVQTRLAELENHPGLRVDGKSLQKLEGAEQSRREAEIRMAATAPSVTFEPLQARTTRDSAGDPVEAGTPRPVLSTATFDLDGFGRITIEPGNDAGDLRRAFEETSATLAALLASQRLESLDAARRLVREGEARQAEIELSKKQLAAILPEGMAAAAESLAARRSQLARLAGDSAKPEDASSADPQASRALRRQTQARLAVVEAAFETAQKAASLFASRLAKAEAEAEHLAAAAARLATDLAEAESARTVSALREDLAAAELDRSAKAAILALRQRALDEADPEMVARSLQARHRALDEARRMVAALKEEISALEGELRAQGLSSLGEDMTRLGEEIEVLEARRGRLALEAEAAKLLHATLVEAQREAREQWLGPIKAEVAPFLKLIHPESEVAFDDATLAITGLTRRGVDEDFRRLSAGAREQVAVVTRLALARVLKRGGHPALVILDDALVNTDERRLERMHRVLERAAETMQIVVLTCRERDFVPLGGRMFRL